MRDSTGRTPWLLAIVAIALAIAIVRTGGDPAPVAAAPTEWKIGVVDLAAVFKDYHKSQDLEKKLNAEKEQLEKDIKAVHAKITDLNKQMDPLDPYGQTFRLLEEERDREVATFQLLKRRREDTLKRRIEEYNLILVDDIEQVVKQYGQDKKFSFILKSEGKAFEENKLLLGLKAVLYYTHEIDVTKDIVDILNARFKAGGGQPPPAAPQRTEKDQPGKPK